jgi:transposase
MRALSLDLRIRIVEAYESGEGSYEAIAERFSVGPTVIGKLVRQKKDLGTVASQVHRRGRKAAVSGEKEVELRKHLEEHPDATVLERRDALGLKCSEKTLWQTLRKMGWRFKKSRRVPPNKIEQTLS